MEQRYDVRLSRADAEKLLVSNHHLEADPSLSKQVSIKFSKNLFYRKFPASRTRGGRRIMGQPAVPLSPRPGVVLTWRTIPLVGGDRPIRLARQSAALPGQVTAGL
jgi:hypothetical protein